MKLMFTLFTYVYSSLSIYTHVYSWLLMPIPVYLCLCMFTHAYPFLLMFTILFTLANLCFLWSRTFEFDNLNNCDNFYYCVHHVYHVYSAVLIVLGIMVLYHDTYGDFTPIINYFANSLGIICSSTLNKKYLRNIETLGFLVAPLL